MFTGIVEELGRVRRVEARSGGARLEIGRERGLRPVPPGALQACRHHLIEPDVAKRAGDRLSAG